MSVDLRTILMISIQVLCNVVDLKYGFDKRWENVLFTSEYIKTCVKINWNYFPRIVLHKVKRFYRLCARFGAVIIVDFYIDDSFLLCLSS